MTQLIENNNYFTVILESGKKHAGLKNEFFFQELQENGLYDLIFREKVILSSQAYTDFSDSTDTVFASQLLFEDFVKQNTGGFNWGGAAPDLTSLLREEFTFTSNQILTLSQNYSQVYAVSVSNAGILKSNEYTLIAPNQIDFGTSLERGDHIVIIYSNASTGVQPYYSQAEVDVLFLNFLNKNVSTTYTTNAVQTVTQAEYDALTPNAETLYFIV